MNNSKFVPIFISLGLFLAMPVNAADGNSVLVEAVRSENLPTVNVLIKARADVNQCDDSNITPMLQVAQLDITKPAVYNILRALVESRSNPNVVDPLTQKNPLETLLEKEYQGVAPYFPGCDRQEFDKNVNEDELDSNQKRVDAVRLLLDAKAHCSSEQRALFERRKDELISLKRKVAPAEEKEEEKDQSAKEQNKKNDKQGWFDSVLDVLNNLT